MKRIEKRLQLLEETIFRDPRKEMYIISLLDVIAFEKIFNKKEHKNYKVFVMNKSKPFMDIFFSHIPDMHEKEIRVD
jgi:hypothetical protein